MDDKVIKILELQEQGVPRKEIYKIMEYKEINSLNRFMKRKGFILDEGIYKRAEAAVDALEDAKDNINVISKEEAPEDMNINIIGANIDDIGLCGGFGEPLIIVHDIDVVDAPDIKVINIEPATKVI